MKVANCSKCRRIFQRTNSSLCPACHQDSLAQISSAYRFIQSNPNLTLEEISSRSQIPYKDLEQMLLDGKLGTAANSVIYHCQRCGGSTPAKLRRGRFCCGCAEKIENEAGLERREPEKRGDKTKVARGDLVEDKAPSSHEGAIHSPALGAERTEGPVDVLKPAGAASSAESYGFKRVSEG